MKTFCHQNSNENFKKACDMSEKNFTHAELLSLLEEGDIAEKQIAILNLQTILNTKEAMLLLHNLTGCDGKIREAAAYKISEILDNDAEKKIFFLDSNTELAAKIFADATIDINGNICRFVLNTVYKLKNDINFSKLYTSKIVDIIFSAFSEIDKFIYKDKKYIINKQLFKLYWCLEAINIFKDYTDTQTLGQILVRASKEDEYTIREKVAQILTDIKDEQYNELKTKLKADANYYVRKVFL